MKKTQGYFLAASLAMAAAASGQTVQTGGGIAYQQAFSIGPGAPGPVIMSSAMLGPELNPQTVTGSPFSAARETHSLQVLGDGTRIERTETSQYYRDSQGRTRIETGAPGSGRVMIQDPVAGVMAALNPAEKTAQKMPAPPMPKVLTGAALPANVARTHVQVRDGAGGNVVFADGAAGPVTAGQVTGIVVNVNGNGDGPGRQPSTEDLGTQTFSGTTAAGRRTTLTIAPGEIGNDRAIQVVSETWYSSDLQMVVKSSNTDPRFGDTTFELTNINRAEPDPALFRIPAEYAVSEGRPTALRAVLPKE
jgi:hypothetical protein